VSHLFATGANDVLVAREGERERLIPFVVGQYIHNVDFDAGRVVVDWDPEF
ncbi:MAG: ribosome maturation factor RimM, partial [Lysobacteraceae bacterium]